MLTFVEQILFILLAIASASLAFFTFRQAIRVIRRGEGSLQVDMLPTRVWHALDVMLTQRTVLKTRAMTSLFHTFVVWGFLFYVLINAGDLIEGFADIQFLGNGQVGDIYRLLGDILSIFILVGIVYFLVRRFLVNADTLQIGDNVKVVHPKARLGLLTDSLIVGTFILVHVGARFVGESFWIALHGDDAWQPFATVVASLWADLDQDALEIGEHLAWWLAIGSILVFVPYFPYTKHMHLFMGPMNYFARPERASLGALDTLDFEDEEREQFGAAKLEHLSKSQLFDAFACIMCNRCQDACPAYVTGKELSPSVLEINKRYEMKGHMSALAQGESSPLPLLDFAISPSAVWACTACGACVEVCPVGNEPMFDIIDIRRDLVLTQGEFPSELQGAFRGMETQGNPWQMSESRLTWAEGLDVPIVDEADEIEVLFWVGCAGAFEPRSQRIARAFVQIMNAAGVKFAVLGEQESCTGDTARRAGNEYLFYEMALANIEMLDTVNPPRIVATCPHCFHTLGKEYPQFGGHYEVVHHTTFIYELIGQGRLAFPVQETANVTFHDPCYLGRHNDILDAPRFALGASGVAVTEMQRIRKNSFCCGAGGGQFWKEEEHGTARVNIARYAEAGLTGAETLAVACPFCMRMFEDASQDESGQGGPQVKDIAEIVAERAGLTF